MSWKAMLNFRVDLSYVTDGAGETWAGAEGGFVDVYPTTRNSLTFGYPASTSAEGRNRSTGLDPRLAGIHFTTGGQVLFRLDLPATGDYLLRGAFGDGVYGARSDGYIQVLDDATGLFTIDHTTGFSGANQWRDINDVLRSGTGPTWLDSETRAVNFSSTICRVAIGLTAGPRPGWISHFSVEQVVSGSSLLRRIMTEGLVVGG